MECKRDTGFATCRRRRLVVQDFAKPGECRSVFRPIRSLWRRPGFFKIHTNFNTFAKNHVYLTLLPVSTWVGYNKIKVLCQRESLLLKTFFFVARSKEESEIALCLIS